MLIYESTAKSLFGSDCAALTFFLLRNSSSEPVLSVVRPAPARALIKKRACFLRPTTLLILSLRPLAVILLLLFSAPSSWRRSSSLSCRLTVDFFAAADAAVRSSSCLIQPCRQGTSCARPVYMRRSSCSIHSRLRCVQMLYLIYYTLNSAAFQQLCAEHLCYPISTIKRPRPYPLLVAVTGLK